jgi:hypothetical protein
MTEEKRKYYPPTDEGILLKQYELADMYEGKRPMPDSWNSHEIFAALLALKWVLTGKGLP